MKKENAKFIVMIVSLFLLYTIFIMYKSIEDEKWKVYEKYTPVCFKTKMNEKIISFNTERGLVKINRKYKITHTYLTNFSNEQISFYEKEIDSICKNANCDTIYFMLKDNTKMILKVKEDLDYCK
jgi:hypothetical protein